MNFTPFPTLYTERLVLRSPELRDAEEVLYLRSDPAINEFVKRPTPKDLSEAEAFINKVSSATKENKSIYWAISLKENDKMIGSICLWNFSEDLKVGETGYDLHPSYQSLGIMSEALKAVIKFGLETLYLETISAYTHRDNLASLKLLTKHNFIHQEGRTDNDNADNVILELHKGT